MSDGLRPGVLFDVDGTLVDTNYLHTLAWSRALRAVGEWAPMNAIHRRIGMGGKDLLVELLGHDSAEARHARPSFFKELAPDIRRFPKVVDLLRTVRSEGNAVVLATSAPKDELKLLRSVLDADGVIDGQTTADDVERAKPAPDVFVTAMRTFSLDPQRTVAVGDSVWDVQAAQAIGLVCLAVESGGFSEYELKRAGAQEVYRDVADILDSFDEGPIARLGCRSDE